MSLQHFTLDDNCTYVASTYLSTLHVDNREDDHHVGDHPGSYSVRADKGFVTFALFHGRRDPAELMNDWGFQGPKFDCHSIAHDTDRILLQDCDLRSLLEATLLGLEVNKDTITLHYFNDLVVVPNFQGGKAYFGDHSTYIERDTL